MTQATEKGPLFGPKLVLDEKSLTCGYAPRILLVSRHADQTIFVGCKDGSVSVLTSGAAAKTTLGKLRGEAFGLQHSEIAAHPVGTGAIRALCEWDEDHLLVARSNSALEFLRWRQSTVLQRLSKPDQPNVRRQDSVRGIVRLGGDRFGVVYRESGLVEVARDSSGNLRVVDSPALDPKDRSGSKPLRFVFPLYRGKAEAGKSSWLLVSDRGDFLSWSGKAGEEPILIKGIWPMGRRPSLIADSCILRSEAARKQDDPGDGILLATDRGLYYLFFEEPAKEGEGEVKAKVRRLSLSGLNASPMTLAHLSTLGGNGERHEYLLVTDLMGLGNLYWRDAEAPGAESDAEEGEGPRFQRSGVVHARSETLLSALLPKPNSNAFVAVQIRRDDRIVLRHYWEPELDAGETSERLSGKDDRGQALVLRKLLNFGLYTPASAQGGTGKRLDGPDAVRAYWKDHRNEVKGTQEELDDPTGWSDSFVLAELFEYLGEDEHRRVILLESLRAPYSEVARSILESASTAGEVQEQEASRLWLLSFLSVIHRTPGDQTASYLALLRWLRHRQIELQSKLNSITDVQGPKSVASATTESLQKSITNLDRDLLLARKWGLRGGVNNDRENLVEPLRIIRIQEEAALGKEVVEEVDRLRWERLTYQSELLGRCVSLFHESKDGLVRGRTAWATSVCRTANCTYIAVSWMWGGVEVFKLAEPEAGEDPVLTFVGGDYGTESHQPDSHVLELQQKPKSDIFPTKYGYSRIVHLGRLGDRVYLISAPAFERGIGSEGEAHRAVVFGWLLENGGQEEVRTNGLPFALELEGVQADSLYSLLELDEGKLLAGLSGGPGKPSLVLIQVEPKPSSPSGLEVLWLETLKLPFKADIEGAGSKKEEAIAGGLVPGERWQAGRNRVWALATISRTGKGIYRLGLGLDSGEILQFDLDWKRKIILDPNREGGRDPLVGRMGSPVHVLACQPDTPRSGPVRLFAGGEDGAIVAWQEISEAGKSQFATLWATSEQGAISSIHFCKFQKDGLVVAVTREGRCVAFDNRAQIEAPDQPVPGTPGGTVEPRRSTRVPLPGSRHGRRYLRSSSFASSVIEGDSLGRYWKEAEGKLGAFFALLVATDDGRLRIVSLHSPDATAARKAQYEEILRLWWQLLRRPIDFRLTEAAFKASPTLSLIVVRYFLDSQPQDSQVQASSPPRGETDGQSSLLGQLGEQRWFLPRHLRPLFRLNSNWDRLYNAGLSPSEGLLADPLSSALERAWKLDDLNLFQEICKVVLRRVNKDLSRVASLEDPAADTDKENVCFAFLEILRAIERSLQRWVSARRKREAGARMVVAKHLVDGETDLGLFRGVSNERPRSAPERELAEEDRPAGSLGSYTFRTVLNERVRSVRELVNKRHPLVSLESVRAVNLSLARLCRLLVAQRKTFCGTGLYLPPAASDRAALQGCEVLWEYFEEYFQDLATAAERAFHTPLELNDAVAHEFSRTFALCLCACPSAALRIEAVLTEKRLMQNRFSGTGFYDRVLAQLRTLRAIGLDAPLWADELLTLGSQPPKDGWNPADDRDRYKTLEDVKALCQPEGEEVLRVHRVAGLGSQNEEDLGHLESIYKVLAELDELANSLETAADRVDLLEARWKQWERLLIGTRKKGRGNSRFRMDYEGGLDGAYKHSWSFWEEAFHDRPPAPSATPSDPSKVQPETVRYCPQLARWADSRVADIKRRAEDGRLLEPEVTTYSRVFRRLAQAADKFPSSAAIHFNIIQGILGHHLLEDLDEHALELEEIAEVLNPRKVWDFRNDERRREDLDEGERKKEGVAERFASYLIGRARSAESIPASLRTLLALSRTTDEPSDEVKSLSRLVEPSIDEEHRVDWRPAERLGVPLGNLEAREARYLRMVLVELDLNQRKYAWPSEAKRPKELHPTFRFLDDRGVSLEFPFDAPKGKRGKPTSNYRRLQRLMKSRMQSPCEPAQHEGVDSSGTGLYLANLAAAIVSWDLEIVEVKVLNDRSASFVVELTRLPGVNGEGSLRGTR